MPPILELNGASKSFGRGYSRTTVLRDLNLTVEEASEAISKLEKACETARAKAAA